MVHRTRKCFARKRFEYLSGDSPRSAARIGQRGRGYSRAHAQRPRTRIRRLQHLEFRSPHRERCDDILRPAAPELDVRNQWPTYGHEESAERCHVLPALWCKYCGSDQRKRPRHGICSVSACILGTLTAGRCVLLILVAIPYQRTAVVFSLSLNVTGTVTAIGFVFILQWGILQWGGLSPLAYCVLQRERVNGLPPIPKDRPEGSPRAYP